VARQEKIDKVNELKEIFKNSYGLIFTDHSRLKAKDAVVVRDKLVGINSYLKIIKNTFAIIAAKDVFKDIDLEEVFKGPTTIIVSGEDKVSTAKQIKGFSKDLDALRIKAGILENEFMDPKKVERIADLPGEEVLLANLIVSMKSPISKLVNVLSALTRNLVVVLDTIREKKENNSN